MTPTPSYPGYSVDADGAVFTHRKGERIGKTGKSSLIVPGYARQLRPHVNPKGYLVVGIRVNGRTRPVGAHQLVADAFHGPAPSPVHQVRHLDGNCRNNDPSNLAWGTNAENAADRVRHGGYSGGAAHQNAKLTELDVHAILRQRGAREKVADLARGFGVSVSTIEGILYGKTYRAEAISFRPVEEARG